MFREDNLIFKIYGNNKLMAVKLWSAPNKEPGKPRVVKAKFEFREFDKRRQQGDKTTGQVDVYMDIEKFGYICKQLESSRIYSLFGTVERGKAAIQHFSGTQDSKSIQISQGDRLPVMFLGQQGPGLKGNNGQTIPDYKSWNEQNSKKIYIGLSDEDAVKLGMCGLRAINILDAWTVAGAEEAELARINPVIESRQNAGYQEPQRQMMPDERYAQEIAAQQRGFNQTGYPQDYGYRDQGYANNGYAQQAVWQ